MALPAVRETGAGGLDALEPYFGGNHNLNMVLCHGGMLYIDEGRPMPGLIDKTMRNLREVQPTMLFNVPRGFDMLLPFL